jgi:hypothetical protein
MAAPVHPGQSRPLLPLGLVWVLVLVLQQPRGNQTISQKTHSPDQTGQYFARRPGQWGWANAEHLIPCLSLATIVPCMQTYDLVDGLSGVAVGKGPTEVCPGLVSPCPSGRLKNALTSALLSSAVKLLFQA